MACAFFLALALVRPGLVAQAAADGRAVVFLVDTSGSLRPDDLERARTLARRVAGSLDPGDRVGVVSFDDRPTVRAPLGSDRASFERALDALAISGRYTALHDGLYDAANLLGASGQSRRAIILLSDGRDERSALLFEDAERALRDRRVAVLVVGVGARSDERFLRRLAKLGGGEFYPAERLRDPDSLARTLSEALAGVPAVPGLVTGEAGAVAPAASATVPPVAVDRPSGADGGPAPGATVAAAGTPAPTSAAAVAEAPALVPAGEPPPAEPALRPAVVLAVTVVLLGALAILLLLRRRQPVSAEPGPARPPDAAAESTQGDWTEDEATIGSRTQVAPGSYAHAGRTELTITPPVASVAAEPGGGEEEGEPLDPLAGTVRLDASPLDELGASGGEALDRTFLLEERPVLVVRKGRNSGETYLLRPQGETYLGRAKVNEIALDDNAVSGRHLRVRVEGKVVTAHDLHSTNGSWLNDRRLSPGVDAPLQEGDVLRLGESELVFRVEQRRR